MELRALASNIKRTIDAAGSPSQREPVGLDRGDGKRPVGVTLFLFRSGECRATSPCTLLQGNMCLGLEFSCKLWFFSFIFI